MEHNLLFSKFLFVDLHFVTKLQFIEEINVPVKLIDPSEVLWRLFLVSTQTLK